MALSVVVPLSWVGENVEVYFAFMTADKARIADSVYLGSLEITA